MFDISKLGKFLPTVERPIYKLSFNKKLMWTGIVLVIYFMLSSQFFGHIYGVSATVARQFQTIQMLFGSTFGTLMTLGIGPIVTSSILLQLLVGSKIIDWDMSDEGDKRKYDIIQKLVAIILCFVEATAFVLGGSLPPVTNDWFTRIIVILQLALGGLIVMLLDEIVSKYGIGSGISLFIAAGVTNRIFIGFFSPCVAGSTGCVLPTAGSEPIGRVWRILIYLVNNEFTEILSPLLPILATIVVFLIIVYTQGISVDIPLAFSAVRGFGRRWSLKLFYTSNIPVILALALLSQFQLVSTIIAKPSLDDPNMRCSALGCFTEVGGRNEPTSGIIYYLSAPSGILFNILTRTVTTKLLLRALTYTFFMVICAVVFSVFWVKTSGMDAESIAEQITSLGMQIPGYRKDPRIIKKVLDKYIPPLAVLGGAAIGLLAAFADFTGALGTGTGILLTVTIIYNLYEQVKNEKLEGAHPLVRKVLEV